MALKTNEERAIEVLELTDKIEALAKEEQEMKIRHAAEEANVINRIEGAKGNLKAAKENLAKIVTAREPEKVLTVNGRALLVSKKPSRYVTVGEAGEVETEEETTVKILPHVKVK